MSPLDVYLDNIIDTETVEQIALLESYISPWMTDGKLDYAKLNRTLAAIYSEVRALDKEPSRDS